MPLELIVLERCILYRLWHGCEIRKWEHSSHADVYLAPSLNCPPLLQLRLGMWARSHLFGNCGSNTAYRRLTAPNGVCRKHLRVSGLGSSFVRMPHGFRPTPHCHSGLIKTSPVTASSPCICTGLENGNHNGDKTTHHVFVECGRFARGSPSPRAFEYTEQCEH